MLLMALAPAHAQNLIVNGDFKDSTTGWHVYTHIKQPLVSEVVAGPDESSMALRVTIPDLPTLKKFQVGFSQPINSEIAADDKITLHFLARSPQSLKIGAMVHTLKEPHRNKFYKAFELTTDWQPYEMTGAKPEAYASGEAGLEFFLAYGAGQVEIAKIEITKE